MRYDAATGTRVPLTTRAGSPVGKRVFEPAPLESGQRITNEPLNAFKEYYDEQACNYLELLALDLNDPVFRDFAPSMVAETVIGAFAYHDMYPFADLIMSRRNGHNSTAVLTGAPELRSHIPADDGSPYDGDVYDAIGRRMRAAADYFEDRGELTADLARLTSFKLLMLVSQQSTPSHLKGMSDYAFFRNGICGYELLSEFASANQVISDLGPGPTGLFYMIDNAIKPFIVQPENNLCISFILANFARMLGKADSFLSLNMDVSRPEQLDTVRFPACGHVQANGVMHHFDNPQVDGLATFINKILKPGGTFSILDNIKDPALYSFLLVSLEKNGLKLPLSGDQTSWEQRLSGKLFHFTLEGSKPV